MTTLKLMLRTRFGWSGHPEELSYFGKMRLRLATVTAFFILLSLIALVGLPGRGSHGFNSVNFSHALQRTLPFDFVVSLAVFAYFGLPAIGSLMLARRAASNVLTTTQGRCFEVLLAPSIYLFARVGPTLESADWYPLPIEWDTVVMPSNDTYEIEYLPTSGWVHRVRRFGASPRELVQPAPSEVNGGAHAVVDVEEDTQPTAEEQRELRRYARRVLQFWGESAASIAACGWSFIVLGVILGPGTLAFYFWVMTVDPPRHPYNTSDTFAILAFLAVLCIFGCGTSVFGVWTIVLWGRMRRAAQQGSQSVEGDIVSWIPRNQDRETIVKVRVDDGETKILRVRRSFNHRVRRVGRRVRIDYMPVSEYVTDVRYAEALVRAN
ncbi:MAG: hypothetical protein ACXVCX_04015 [Ktedonobacterales bacterium]